jgi:hypothetical protein
MRLPEKEAYTGSHATIGKIAEAQYSCLRFRFAGEVAERNQYMRFTLEFAQAAHEAGFGEFGIVRQFRNPLADPLEAVADIGIEQALEDFRLAFQAAAQKRRQIHGGRDEPR